ncbi:MAG: glycosyltransferase family 39 protein, partial [Solirubrobacteraceae bacterium]
MILIESRSRRRHPPADVLVILLPAAVGALLCAIDLGSRSLWLDEGSTFAIASQHGEALWRGIGRDGGNMLAYYLLIHVLIGWLGDASWLLRLPSVIANAATGALVAAIGLRLLGRRRAALAAGLLTVAAPVLIYWGQQARGYSLMVTFTCASFLALIAILQTPARYRAPRRWVAVYVISLLAAFYIGYDVALVIPAQLLMLWLFPERTRVILASLVLVAVLSTPLAVLALERGSGQLFWVPGLSLQVAGQTLTNLLYAGIAPSFHRAWG